MKNFTFVGKIKSIEIFGKRRLVIIPIEFNPKFAVTIYIEKVRQKITAFQKGSDIVFGIHSPARFFRGLSDDKIINNLLRFNVTWDEKQSRVNAITIAE